MFATKNIAFRQNQLYNYTVTLIHLPPKTTLQSKYLWNPYGCDIELNVK